jgi:hypothetical protein
LPSTCAPSRARPVMLALFKSKRRRRESDSTPPRSRLAHEALCQLKGDPLQDEVSLYDGRPSLYRAFWPIRPTTPILPLRTVQNSRTDVWPTACASRVPMKMSQPRIWTKWSAPRLNQMHSVNTSDFLLFSAIDRLSPQFQSSIAYSLSPLVFPLITAFPDLKRSPQLSSSPCLKSFVKRTSSLLRPPPPCRAPTRTPKVVAPILWHHLSRETLSCHTRS